MNHMDGFVIDHTIYLYFRDLCTTVFMLFRGYVSKLFTSGSRGGGRTRRAPPPNGRGPKIFYAQNANFSQFFLRSLRSRLILSIILIEIWQKHAKI